jgi:hypothetical protein
MGVRHPGQHDFCPHGLRSAERAEEFAHVVDQEVGCFHGGEVPAAAEFGPVHDVVVAFGEGRTAKRAHGRTRPSGLGQRPATYSIRL